MSWHFSSLIVIIHSIYGWRGMGYFIFEDSDHILYYFLNMINLLRRTAMTFATATEAKVELVSPLLLRKNLSSTSYLKTLCLCSQQSPEKNYSLISKNSAS